MKPETTNRLLALREYHAQAAADIAARRARFSELAGRHENGTAPRAVAAFNLFQTPAAIAERMSALVAGHVQEGGRILEPSAGLGRLYGALRLAVPESCRIVMVENSPDCCRELYAVTGEHAGDRLFQRDFMEQEAGDLGGLFNAVCMNPPFKMGTDIRHIRHALTMLAPGGLLVALCYDGARQNASLRPDCDTWEGLPADSFREAGTGASVAMITIKKGELYT